MGRAPREASTGYRELGHTQAFSAIRFPQAPLILFLEAFMSSENGKLTKTCEESVLWGTPFNFTTKAAVAIGLGRYDASEKALQNAIENKKQQQRNCVTVHRGRTSTQANSAPYVWSWKRSADDVRNPPPVQ